MAQILQASTLSLQDVQAKFNVQYIHQALWFQEWQIAPPDFSDHERYVLDKAQRDFIYLVNYPVHEEVVKLVTLAPLLSVAGFYQPPFHPVAEHSVEIALEEGSEDGEKVVLRGKIDILLLYRHLWVAVIEAKQKRFNLLEALPQTLAYLLSNPDATGSQFALLANGTEFLFVKLLRKELPQSPQYSFSRLFSLWNPGNELDHVVGILRHLGQEVVNLGANGYREWGNAET